MSKPIGSETIEYERFVDGLRRENAELRGFAEYVANHLLSLSLSLKPGSWGLVALTRYQALSISNATASSVPKTITVHVEGGLVQDVTGIPAGYEVRVEDHDGDDTSHPAWDAEKECFVTVYEGDSASDSPAHTHSLKAVELADAMGFPSEVLQLTEIDADDGDLALQALSKIRARARAVVEKVKGGAS